MNGPDKNGWLPMADAPKDGSRVLLYVPPYGAMSGHYSQWGPRELLQWNCHSAINQEAQPTKWQPLPAPPKDSSHD